MNSAPKRIIIDLDNTLTIDTKGVCYSDKQPNLPVIEKLLEYKNLGFHITIFTARNMNTFKGNIQLIEENTLPKIKDWLEKNKIIYDDILIGKPWCGSGFYVDDKAIRPDEFVQLTFDQVQKIINDE